MSTVSDESDGPSHFACLDKPIFHDLIRSVQVDENHSWNVTLEAIGHPMPMPQHQSTLYADALEQQLVVEEGSSP